MANGLRNRLLVPVAFRLQRWSEQVLGNDDHPALPDRITESPDVVELQDRGPQLVKNETAMLSSRETGPPLDWSSRSTSSPPAHWLELVRQRAPQLLRADYPRVTASAPKRRRPQRSERRPPVGTSTRIVTSRRSVLGPIPPTRQKRRDMASP